MRAFLIFLWLLVPLGVAAYHYGPGQERMRGDEADGHLAEARQLLADGDASGAVELLDKALATLPEHAKDAAVRLRLEKAKAMMECSGLPKAHDDLVALLDDLTAAQDTPQDLIAETKSTLASAKYYRTWLMRLEGHPREVWEPEIEAARQYYTSAADHAKTAGDAHAIRTAQEDVEAAIKLARIDLAELQGLPLPSQ